MEVVTLLIITLTIVGGIYMVGGAYMVGGRDIHGGSDNKFVTKSASLDQMVRHPKAVI